MAKFAYTAKTPQGRLTSGTLEAASPYEVAQRLARSAYVVTTVKEVKGGPPSAQDISSILTNFFLRFLVSVKSQDLLFFYLQLSVMISAGVPIIKALEIMQAQTRNERLRAVLEQITTKIRQGKSFSDALADYPDVFPKILVSTVHAGEMSGELDKGLKQLAEFSEMMAKMQGEVKAALTYPIFLGVVGTGVIFFLIIFVIPGFMDIFARSGVELPGPTKALATLSAFLRGNVLLVLAGSIGAACTTIVYLQTPVGRYQLDIFKLRAPVVGPILSGIALSRFSHTLSTVLSSGVPILTALDLAKENLGNRVLALELERATKRVREGKELSGALAGTHFSSDVVQMLKIGESTGKMDLVLEKVAQLYDMHVGHQIKQLTAMIEPCVLLVGGGLVGFIMAAVILPMFDLVKALRS